MERCEEKTTEVAAKLNEYLAEAMRITATPEEALIAIKKVKKCLATLNSWADVWRGHWEYLQNMEELNR